ncbi:MAG: hypothetical protein EBR82_34320 [Caulobacteraceae bacterium]|nr:hypothetical protein [Caulobacteraceae bacterium]
MVIIKAKFSLTLKIISILMMTIFYGLQFLYQIVSSQIQTISLMNIIMLWLFFMEGLPTPTLFRKAIIHEQLGFLILMVLHLRLYLQICLYYQVHQSQINLPFRQPHYFNRLILGQLGV